MPLGPSVVFTRSAMAMAPTKDACSICIDHQSFDKNWPRPLWIVLCNQMYIYQQSFTDMLSWLPPFLETICRNQL
jgi:hypothetical protein